MFEFNVGDKVITAIGQKGVVVAKNPANNGFDYKIELFDKDGKKTGSKWVTRYDRSCGFSDYYSIGDVTFGNYDIDFVERKIYDFNRGIEEWTSREATLREIIEQERLAYISELLEETQYRYE